MFGIDFSEFLVIGIVALIVLGPERLPKVARTAGHLFGRFQRYVSEVKAQVKQEMDAEEFTHIKSQFQEVKDAASGMEQSIRGQVTQVQSHLTSPTEIVGPLPSLDFAEEPVAHVSHPAPIPEPSPQMELPLAPAEPVVKPPADRAT
jgi:sec-independent protein translocase protein TatB